MKTSDLELSKNGETEDEKEEWLEDLELHAKEMMKTRRDSMMSFHQRVPPTQSFLSKGLNLSSFASRYPMTAEEMDYVMF